MRKTPLFVVVAGWSVILAFCPSGATQGRSDGHHSAAAPGGKQPAARSGRGARAPGLERPGGSSSATPAETARSTGSMLKQPGLPAGAQPISSAARAAPAGQQAPASTGSRQGKPRSDVAAASARKAPPGSSPKRGVVLVPPPPPAIPAGGQLTFLSGTPVEFLSESDLKRHKEQLDLNLSRARQQADEQERLLKEKVQRAELFASLYKEGVVSRRELENSQREVGRSEGDLTDARLKVTDLERDMQRIDERLKQLASGKAAQKQAKRGKK
ncbi:MAG TPA: hypothetical protein V6D08_01485 [Candidatus Obscuribacterales bacterium]